MRNKNRIIAVAMAMAMAMERFSQCTEKLTTTSSKTLKAVEDFGKVSELKHYPVSQSKFHK
jgi:hypothetical protein